MKVVSIIVLLAYTGYGEGYLKQTEPWDHFVFTQQWPQSLCIDDNHKHHCEIPTEVTTWTIHGLWPSKGSEEGPTGCPGPQFNATKVQPLETQLKQFWPNLFANTVVYSFWEHEWDKHGTCCQDLPSTTGEYNYFSSTLRQASIYNVTAILGSHGIVPSDTKGYTYAAVSGALQGVLGDPVSVLCSYNKVQHKSYLYSVEMCLSKDFKIIACPPRDEPVFVSGELGRAENCWANETVWYPPIQHSSPAAMLVPARIIDIAARIQPAYRRPFVPLS